MKFKRALFLFFALMLAFAVITGCNGSPADNINGADSADNAQTNDGAGSAGTDSEYIFPDIDGGGKDLRILNPVNDWGFYCYMDFEEMPSTLLDAAIYNRNRFIEEQFNINLRIEDIDKWGVYTDFRLRLYSGLDIFDIAYMPASVWDRATQQVIGRLATEGLVKDLKQISSINFDGRWWNQTTIRESLIRGKLFFAENDIHIMTLQTMTCIYFNKEMMADLGLELPYELVRNGTWTFDRLIELQRAGANLNGADSFSYRRDNPSVFGLTASAGAAPALIMGAQERFVVMDAGGTPQLAVDGERFMRVIDQAHEILSGQPGMFHHGNNPGHESDCAQVFRNGKALMLLGELRYATEALRDMETDFGIVPMPKFDERQDGYYNLRFHLIPLVVIPINSANPEFAGAVLDAWAYKSYANVTPVLFDVAVSHKGLRDDDSIEMLQIIRESGSFCVGMIYGWTTDLAADMQGTLGVGGRFDAASRIERLRDTMQANIDQSMAFFDE